MTEATLTLDGTDPIEGTVETGGDYIRFTTAGPLPRQPDPLHKGRIEIEGRVEKVMVKSVQDGQPDGDGVELTLQRFQPSPS